MKTLNFNENCDCVCSCAAEITPTPAQRKGYIVGVSLFRLNQDERTGARVLDEGDIVVLCNDDGSHIPEFQLVSAYTKDPESWKHDYTHCSFCAFDTDVTFIGNHELKPQEMHDCTCKCTCTPAKVFGLVEGKTVVRVLRNHMTDYGMHEGTLAVFVEDDGSECIRFQRLEEYLEQPATQCSREQCSCYLSLGEDRIEIVPKLEIKS